MLLCNFFGVILLVIKYTLCPHTFVDVVSLVETSTILALTFFYVILIAEKSVLFTRTFFTRFDGKRVDVALVKLQGNETLEEVFLC